MHKAKNRHRIYRGTNVHFESPMSELFSRQFEILENSFSVQRVLDRGKRSKRRVNTDLEGNIMFFSPKNKKRCFVRFNDLFAN